MITSAAVTSIRYLQFFLKSYAKILKIMMQTKHL